MFLKNLNLTNFRNYQNLNFEFKNRITLLFGDNAQGKSSFLEAIYFLATTKSPKVEREDQLIRFREDVLRVQGELEGEVDLEVAIQSQDSFIKKRIKVNGVPRRVVDYSSNIAVILFSPEDINLVIGSPGERRSHLDLTLGQIDRDYKKVVTRYENVITRKNKVLKNIREGQASKEELIFWTDQQILLGSSITAKREEFFNFLNSSKKKFGNFYLKYKPSIVNALKLIEYQEKEIASASSLIGPHRDDFEFSLDGKDLSIYGSRGEQRTAVLDLKLAELEYFEHVLKDRPILLLDDIFSELDERHQEHVIEIAKLQQTIIAAVEIHDFIQAGLSKADSKIYFISDGTISSA